MAGDLPISRRPDRKARWLAALVVLAAALVARLPLVDQSLWYDEMYTLLHFVQQPVLRIVAGPYSPNNHTLHSLLAKLSLEAAEGLGLAHDGGGFAGQEPLLRLPSMLAGAACALALAWPLRRQLPLVALVIALVAALQPWLLAVSSEARGYALALLLAIVATNLLSGQPPGAGSPVFWRYSVAIAAMLYTVPITLAVLPGHALVIALLYRRQWKPLAMSMLLGVLLALVLYLPQRHGMVEHYRQLAGAALSPGQFVGQVLSMTQTGLHGLRTAPAAVAAMVLLGGSMLAWQMAALRPMVLTFAVAVVVAVGGGVLVPGARQLRFVPWTIPLYCLGMAALLSLAWRRPRAWAFPLTWLSGAAGVVLLVSLVVSARQLITVPAQPIRDALQFAHQQAGGQPVLALHLGAAEAASLYGADAVVYGMAGDRRWVETVWLQSVERRFAAARPWLVVFDPVRVQSSDPALWRAIQSDYELVQRFAGRITPALVYHRRTALP